MRGKLGRLGKPVGGNSRRGQGKAEREGSVLAAVCLFSSFVGRLRAEREKEGRREHICDLSKWAKAL